MPIPWLDSDTLDFPPPAAALVDPNGLLAAGGDLSPERLVEAYRRGIFPWYVEGQPILWWSPNPRMVLFPDQILISGSFKKFLRKHAYTVEMDVDFSGVLKACAGSRNSGDGTWITADMQAAYLELHHMGIAHSVEVRDERADLVGGLYGVALGQLFFGESMFSKRPNTSKLALAFLTAQMRNWGFAAIDCQVPSTHLASLGAVEMDRLEFQQLLKNYRDKPGKPGSWQATLLTRQLSNEF